MNFSSTKRKKALLAIFLALSVFQSCTAVTCDASCNTCSGTAATQCTSCIGSTFLDSTAGTCVATCPNGTFAFANQCQACTAPCATCHGTATTCITCSGGNKLHNGSCVASCPDGTFEVTGECFACDSTCKTCDAAGVAGCLTCETTTGSNKHFLGKKCLASCPTNGYFINTGDLVCTACDSSCLTCSAATATDCLTCPTTGTLWKEGNSCKTACGTAFYSNDTTKTCEACDSTCATCSGTANNNCLSCGGAGSGGFLVASTKTCTETCPTGFYPKSAGTVHTCEPCHASCTTCSGPADTECLTCTAPKLLQTSGANKSCKDPCDPGFFANGSNCDACDANCKTCATSATNCLTCDAADVSKQYLSGTVCVGSCSAGTAVAAGVCSACHADCATCSTPASATACLTCSAGKPKLFNATCNTTCPPGSYDNAGTCTACDASCLTCDGGTATDCLTCKATGATLYLTAQKKCFTTCPSQFFADGSNCTACATPCQNCTGTSTTCTSCDGAGATPKIQSGTCVATCGNGYYENPGNANECLACDSTCSTCAGPGATACLTCAAGKKSQGGACVDACGAGYYQDPGNALNCLVCNFSCATCSAGTSSDCLSCKGANLLQNGTCVASCSDGFFANGPNCSPCNADCATCTTAANTTCLTCAAPKDKLVSQAAGTVGTCVDACADGYFQSGTTPILCKQCDNTCGTCTDAGPTNCTTCKAGVAPYSSAGACVAACPSGTFADANNICQNCHNTCKNCTGADATHCTQCDPAGATPKFYTGTCLADCTTTAVPTFDNAGTCTPCHADCATCSGTANTQCLSCTGALNYLASAGTCIATCPPGTYANANVCSPCNGACDLCTGGTAADCTLCKQSLPAKYLKATACVSDCGPGFHIDGTNCTACHADCVECSAAGNTNCTVCGGAKPKLQVGSCLASCGAGFYQDPANANICLPCDSKCVTCSNGTSCDSCKTNIPESKLQAGQCVSVCSAVGFFEQSTYVCTACHADCHSCTGAMATNCTACSGAKPLFHASGNACYATGSCPATTTVENIGTSRCDDCAAPCATCTGSITTCNSCVAGPTRFHAPSNQCLNPCPPGTFDDGVNCSPCTAPCATCVTSATNCTSCIAPKVFQSIGPCQDFCNDGFYADSQQNCQACNTSVCKHCKGSATTCTACNSPKLLVASTNVCVTSCPTGTFENGEHCRSCNASCVTCSGHKDNCKSCSTGKFLFNGGCFDACPAGYVGQGLNCVPCTGGCATCATTPSTCISCKEGLLQYGNTCSLTCPSAYFSYQGKACVKSCPPGLGPDDNKSCQPCDDACSKCSSNKPGSCLECRKSSMLLFNGECVTKCPSVSFEQGNRCITCPKDCQSCILTPQNKVLCKSCVDPLKVKVQGRCLCMPGTILSAVTNECLPTVVNGKVVQFGAAVKGSPVSAAVNENSRVRHSINEKKPTTESEASEDSVKPAVSSTKAATTDSISKLTVEKTYFVKHNRTAIVRFSDKVDDVALDLLRFSMKDHRDTNVKNYKVISSKIVDDLELHVKLSLHTEVKDNELLINTFALGLISLRSDNAIEFNHYPISVKINYYENETFEDFLNFVQILIFVSSLVTFVICFFVAPSSAFSLIKTLQLASLVRFFNMKQSNNLYFFTDIFADNFFSILYNPLYTEPKMTPAECSYSSAITEHDLECNMFNNVGAYLLIFLVLFAIKLVIFGAYNFDLLISKAMDRQSSAKMAISKFLHVLNDVTSFHYLARVFFFMNIDLFIGGWGILKYTSGNRTTSFYTGAGTLSAFALMNLLLCAIAIASIFIKFTPEKKQMKHAKTGKPMDVAEPAPNNSIAGLFEGNGFKFKLGSKYMAIFAVRDMLVTYFVLFHSGYLLIQVLPLLAFALLELIMVITRGVFDSKLVFAQRTVSIITQILTLTCVLAMNYLFDEFSEKTNYYSFGAFTIMLLTLNVLVEVLFSAYHLIYKVKNFIDVRADRHNRIEPSKSTRRQFKKAGYINDGCSDHTNSEPGEEKKENDVNKLPINGDMNDTERAGNNMEGALASNSQPSSNKKMVTNAEKPQQ